MGNGDYQIWKCCWWVLFGGVRRLFCLSAVRVYICHTGHKQQQQSALSCRQLWPWPYWARDRNRSGGTRADDRYLAGWAVGGRVHTPGVYMCSGGWLGDLPWLWARDREGEEDNLWLSPFPGLEAGSGGIAAVNTGAWPPTALPGCMCVSSLL